MSFKAELEALIANANSSLEDLEEVLRRAQARSSDGQSLDTNDGDVGEIQTQIDTIRQKILTSLVEIRASYHQDQERLSDLEGELKLDLENVRQCAIDYFIKGEYRECERLLTFLAKVQPDDENLQNFLELSRRKQLENEAEGTSPAPDSVPRSEHADREQQLAHESGHQEGDEPPKTNVRRDEVERKGAAESALSAIGARKPEGPLPVFAAHVEERPERIEPQILAEIELKTASHIREMYRTPPHSSKTRFLVGAGVVALGISGAFFWLSRSDPERSVAETVAGSRPGIEEPVSTKDPLADLRREAQDLFDAGKFQEAGRVCETILLKDPQDSFALSLKDYAAILAGPKTPAVESEPPSEPTAQLNPSPIQEAQSDRLQVRSQPVASNASSPPPLTTDRSPLTLKRIDGTVQRPTGQAPTGEQLNAAKQAMPAPAPAAPTPTIPASQAAGVSEIRPDQLQDLNNRIQAKDFEQARLLFGQLESGFPTNPEVKTLGERLRLEVQKQQSLTSSWIEKAEAAWIAGRYVTPPDDNVLVYCNLALKTDPRNQRATSLKKEIVQRAIEQAKDWIERGKFECARLTYASMDYLAAGDNAFPYPKQNIKRELERLAFRNHTVVHDHKLGSCSGILKFNAYTVSYVPSGGSGDGFAESSTSIFLNDEGER